MRDVFELSVAYAMVLLVLWTPRPWEDLLFYVVVLSIAAVLYRRGEAIRPMDFCRGETSSSLWAVAGAACVAMTIVVIAGVLHTFHLPATPSSLIGDTAAYAIWAAIQQVILQCFFLSRLLHILNSPALAATAAALLFAIAHLPSPVLTLVTLVCGLAACLFYLRYRSLMPLVAAHAILGSAIAVSVPVQIDHNMRVGLGYLTYSYSSGAENAGHRNLLHTLLASPLTR